MCIYLCPFHVKDIRKINKNLPYENHEKCVRRDPNPTETGQPGRLVCVRDVVSARHAISSSGVHNKKKVFYYVRILRSRLFKYQTHRVSLNQFLYFFPCLSCVMFSL